MLHKKHKQQQQQQRVGDSGRRHEHWGAIATTLADCPGVDICSGDLK
jgi:hypothetical protein